MNLATSHHETGSKIDDLRELSAELSALREGCGVYSLASRTKILVRGGDRVRWLNGMVTNNVRDLAVGHGVYAFLLNPQGHILGDLYAYNRGKDLIVDTDQSQSVQMLAVFDRYIIMDDVEVETLGEVGALGVAGPKAKAVLAAVGIPVPELQPLQFADLKWRDVDLTLVRGDNPLSESYELWLPSAQISALRDALIHAGAKVVGDAVLELLRVAAGIPRYRLDIRERDLPQETEQARALNFNKGCYIGQEIVERIRSRGAVHRKFTGFNIQGELPAPGTKVELDGKEIGEITSVASVPAEDSVHQVGLGYIRREHATPGKKVRIGGSDASVADLPFKIS
ncbi:MAG TPA: glycine cleavage T C-terminal barrel domain-containing protein [Terriglobales bacterium]|nr:glycine cleavage T C-terminal barrel domain-containing protein [Terriglobales bacterium]